MSVYGSRVCCACYTDLPRSDFTVAQWKKGGGASRCAGCVSSRRLASVDSNPSARTASGATRVRLEGRRAFAHGGQRSVLHARYVDGERAGAAAVAKFFRLAGGAIEAKAFHDDDAVVGWALRFLTQFCNGGAGADAMAALGGPLRLNVPVAYADAGGGELVRGGGDGSGRRYLVEPFVYNFKKYNSNTGHARFGGAVSDALQALSHYSYHSSGGMLVLCDLQCGYAARAYEGGLVLTDPVILSRSAGRYGPTDLGTAGILTFFSQHVCNDFCNARWTKPKDARAVLPVVDGTSMTAATARSAVYVPAFGGVAEEDESYYSD